MNLSQTIKILEALADGCSPSTGEKIANDSVLNEREVIRALQFAIDHLKQKDFSDFPLSKIPEEELDIVVQLFQENAKSLTPSSLTGFFLGNKVFKIEPLLTHHLYGKYRNKFTKGQALVFFTEYLVRNGVIGLEKLKTDPYPEIDFFQKELFNKLSENGINQLKSKISEQGVLKTEDLSPQIINARRTHLRAYEAWSVKEVDLLKKALEFTNDLELLSSCSQRARGSIESMGKKLLAKSDTDS